MANQINLIHICWIVIKNQLCCEIVVSWCFRIEFKANNAKAFSIDKANLWIRFKSTSRVLKNLVVYRSITCISDLECLINWLIRSTTREVNILSWTHFDHWNKWLGTRRERMTNKSYIHADWWVNIFIHCILEFRFFNWSKESLCHGLTLSKFFFLLSLSFLSQKSLVLT